MLPNRPELRLSLTLRCVAALAFVRIGLSILGYDRLRQFLPDIIGDDGSRQYARYLSRHVYRASAFVPGSACLSRAVCLQWLLARSGHASILHVGVRREAEGSIAAHAWVTCGGAVVLGAEGHELAEFVHLTHFA